MSNRLLHFTSPGLKAQLIEVAPVNCDASKRYPLIENEVNLFA